MNIWLIDYQDSDDRRDWEGMFGCPPMEFLPGDAKECRSWDGLEGPGIVVCHGMILVGTDAEAWAEISPILEKKKIWVIVASGSGFVPGASPWKRLYCRKQKVKSGHGAVDNVFKLGFKAFKEDLEQQLDVHNSDAIIPDYSLLEPAAAPVALLSIYLTEMAGFDLDEDLRNTMDRSAQLEYQSLISLGRIKESKVGTWDEIQADPVRGIGALLKRLEEKS